MDTFETILCMKPSRLVWNFMIIFHSIPSFPEQYPFYPAFTWILQLEFGVPEAGLGGHAFHTYQLLSPDGRCVPLL